MYLNMKHVNKYNILKIFNLKLLLLFNIISIETLSWTLNMEKTLFISTIGSVNEA